MNKIAEYLQSIRAEMKHVSWPTKSQAIWFTVIVIVISILTALYLGLFDFIFTEIISRIV